MKKYRYICMILLCVMMIYHKDHRIVAYAAVGQTEAGSNTQTTELSGTQTTEGMEVSKNGKITIMLISDRLTDQSCNIYEVKKVFLVK